MPRRGDCWDNSVMENFFRNMNSELKITKRDEKTKISDLAAETLFGTTRIESNLDLEAYLLWNTQRSTLTQSVKAESDISMHVKSCIDSFSIGEYSQTGMGCFLVFHFWGACSKMSKIKNRIIKLCSNRRF